MDDEEELEEESHEDFKIRVLRERKQTLIDSLGKLGLSYEDFAAARTQLGELERTEAMLIALQKERSGV